MEPGKIFTNMDLIVAAHLKFTGLKTVIVMNTRYCAATRKWVDEAFPTYLWELETARGQLSWAKRGNQCEHFALRAALEVVELFRQMPADQVPADAESIAIAAVKFQRGAGTAAAVWHEVNLWYQAGEWHAWEPQTREYFDFTAEELLTVCEMIIP